MAYATASRADQKVLRWFVGGEWMIGNFSMFKSILFFVN